MSEPINTGKIALYTMLPAEKVTFTYTNYRGELSERVVITSAIRFGDSEWHPESQWLMRAWDIEKNEFREFAMRDMKDFRYAE